MPYPGLLYPELLLLRQATADPYLHRRHSNTQRQVWLSLYRVSWCAHGFVWALWASLMAMGFESKCNFAPPTILLGLLLCPWMWGIFFLNMWTMNFQMFKLVLEKAEESAIKLLTSSRSLKKQESSRKTSISALLTMPKPLTVWITINCGKFWKIWEYQTTWPASWVTCIQVRKQQLELDMEQQTGSK